MVNYFATQGLLIHLIVPKLPKKHWGQPVRWEFAQAMSKVCYDRLKCGVLKASFISANANEVTFVDNQQGLLVHVYDP